MITQRHRAAAAVACLLALPCAHAGTKEGSAAYARDDFATAATDWRPAAEADDPQAQVGMSMLYQYGLGVARNDLIAVQWLRRAVEKGDALGRYGVGYAYFSNQTLKRRSTQHEIVAMHQLGLVRVAEGGLDLR
jgi:TPR repeat protein